MQADISNRIKTLSGIGWHRKLFTTTNLTWHQMKEV
jgi:hypothetical protein